MKIKLSLTREGGSRENHIYTLKQLFSSQFGIYPVGMWCMEGFHPILQFGFFRYRHKKSFWGSVGKVIQTHKSIAAERIRKLYNLRLEQHRYCPTMGCPPRSFHWFLFLGRSFVRR